MMEAMQKSTSAIKLRERIEGCFLPHLPIILPLDDRLVGGNSFTN
jgi:hypothetical protein